MHIDFLLGVFADSAEAEAVIFRNEATSYAALTQRYQHWKQWLVQQQVGAGAVVALRADYSPDSIALFLALIAQGAIVLQVGLATDAKLNGLLETGEAEWLLDATGSVQITRLARNARHELYQQLRASAHPGLVLFSSGSTGQVKGTVHDLALLLGKYQRRRHNLRTLTFLLFDHIGGIDTLFYCLSNGSCIVVVEQRDPASVCALVQRHRVEVLPVAPTFLNMLYFSQQFREFDLSSLRWVTYGAEVMPEQTLKFCREMFPTAQLLQKYGASEIGTPRSQSKGNDSLWMKLGGEGFQWRVVDGLLEIKAASAMLGYLNAPSPFTPDGWFKTGDAVEVDGEYIRVLGRGSDLINVGGKKVYPAEVEAVIKELPEVVEVTVYGEKHALMGQIVAAQIWPADPGADESALRALIKRHVTSRLEAFKTPARITFAHDAGYATERFKKVRQSPGR